LKWSQREALRLAAWVCQRGHAVDVGLNAIRNANAGELSSIMLEVWGDKMGSPRSKEARSELWFFAALSDFNQQIQARDIVSFLAEAAELSIGEKRWAGRVLTPAAMRNALPKCSERKIEEISQENIPVGALLDRLRNKGADLKRVPFSLDTLGLDIAEANLLATNGVLFREDDQYWIPEIFRHGLGFSALGRPRVLAIANLVRRRNDQTT
jgi:hypothetical protein